MSRRNRVDPYGDLFADPARGLFTGNRGCLVDDVGSVVRHHQGNLWITCVLKHKDWKSPLDRPRHWTPLFFLDDAVALAAGHRPCGLCRRPSYVSYRDAVHAGSSIHADARIRPTADVLNRRLSSERLLRGSGLSRAHDRLVWEAPVDSLPEATVIIDGERGPMLVAAGRLFEFTFGGWTNPIPRPTSGLVTVLTPPTSVAALGNGFDPVIHPSASV